MAHFGIIGSHSNDTVFTKSETYSLAGGPARFLGEALSKLGEKVSFCICDELSVVIYEDGSSNAPRVANSCESQIILPENITPEILKSDCIIISTVLDTVKLPIIKFIRDNSNALLAIDLQGFQRRVDPKTGEATKLKCDNSILRSADIVKCSEEEFNIQFGGIDEALEEFREVGTTLLVTRGSSGVDVLRSEVQHWIPQPLPIPCRFSVGAGDRLLGAFCHFYLNGHDAVKSAEMAQVEVSKSLSI